MSSRERTPAAEWRLAAVLAVECAVFALVAERFATAGNVFEIARLSVELGLIAIALTPVIVTGGIDVSVGSLLGLSAVVFGSAMVDAKLPPLAAIAATIAVGAAGGALNALFVARFRIPPLIVTLGTMALFRGIAEGVTEGARNYSGFPERLVALGQGYLWGGVPAQLPILIAAAAGYAILLHRSIVGRGWQAIGFGEAGALYAGIPVSRRLAQAYVLTGAVTGLAAVIYVAHLGQARADAGTGYELSAITAVVLGGASVAGGRGTIGGTLLGLFIVAVLQNGLQLAALPSELVGVLTGVVLIAAIALDRRRGAGVAARSPAVVEGEMPVKNSQVAVLCAAMLAAALIVAGTNVWMVQTFRFAGAPAAAPTPSAAGRRPVIAMMPKAKGDPYFVSCRAGAEEAARDLGVELIWDGPTALDAAKQNELVESWITRQVDAIAVSVENRAGISTVLRKARARGIRVLAWDADAEPDARDYFVNQATPEGIGRTLVDEAARLMGDRGAFAIVTGALSAANQNAWIAAIRERLAAAHPAMTLAVIRPSDDDRDKAFAETQTILRTHPEATLVMAISAPAVPGAAEAVRQAGRTDVKVMGLSLPNMNKPYVHGGVVQTVVLWNTTNLGYLTVQAAAQAVRGQLGPNATSMTAGRLGPIEIRGAEIVLGDPLVMTKANIDQFDF
ncbi:MAG: substrate-binding domain-containing protein [Acidobacteria bacterium]|nr:substrate-binding domain-containing protein [Acidobacteriota bacterium]